MSELPADVWERIESATRENLKPYESDGEIAMPHKILIGSAARPE